MGKTRTLKRIVDLLGRERCGGFYTEEVYAEQSDGQDTRMGFRLVTLGFWHGHPPEQGKIRGIYQVSSPK